MSYFECTCSIIVLFILLKSLLEKLYIYIERERERELITILSKKNDTLTISLSFWPTNKKRIQQLILELISCGIKAEREIVCRVITSIIPWCRLVKNNA